MLHCVDPKQKSKPLQCVTTTHWGGFSLFLLQKPCSIINGIFFSAVWFDTYSINNQCFCKFLFSESNGIKRKIPIGSLIFSNTLLLLTFYDKSIIISIDNLFFSSYHKHSTSMFFVLKKCTDMRK